MSAAIGRGPLSVWSLPAMHLGLCPTGDSGAGDAGQLSDTPIRHPGIDRFEDHGTDHSVDLIEFLGKVPASLSRINKTTYGRSASIFWGA